MPPESKPKTIADNSDEPVVKTKKETGDKPQSASDNTYGVVDPHWCGFQNE